MLSNIDQQYIDVDVDFYNETEREKLLHYPTSDEIRKIIESPLRIPVSEFLTYYLFHKKRPAKSGWQNYREISSKVYKAFSEYYDKKYIDLMKKNMQLLQQEYGIEYYDFSRDTTFSYINKFFYNSDHLNKMGAKEFSKKLLLMINKNITYEMIYNKSKGTKYSSNIIEQF